MKKAKVIILRNELEDDHLLWIRACDEYKDQLEYRVVVIKKNSRLEDIQSKTFDILLAKPGGLTAPFKQLYDERIFILNKILGYPVFPSADEIFIYENKRFLSFWLKANKIPHPRTDVFYDQQDALEYLINLDFPIVGKVNIGASGSGVSILRTREVALEYINRTFSHKGAPRRTGPNMSNGGLFKRGLHYLASPGDISKKLNLYKTIISHPQTNFVIFQEYIPHDFEWRVVRIGNSFFAHKKLKIREKASGSLIKEYENPPLELFDFVKEITDKHKYYSQAIDIFESTRGFLVNEMQCIFGQSDSYQMLVNGVEGRYQYSDGKWLFEEGKFNSNECYNLRVEYIIKKLQYNEGTFYQ
jgi:glutathione synthase/RimK-type ligase-like ATP-grasp enzyme